MTQEQAKQLLPIITAFAEGKTIQYRDKKSMGMWQDSTSVMDFRFNIYTDYRIKPEPKEYWLGLHPDMDYVKKEAGNKKAIAVCAIPYEGPESLPTQDSTFCSAEQFIHVREVIDE